MPELSEVVARGGNKGSAAGVGIGDEIGLGIEAWEAVLNEILELRHTGLLDTAADAYKVRGSLPCRANKMASRFLPQSNVTGGV